MLHWSETTMDNRKVENIMKAFDNVSIEPAVEEISIVADRFGIADLNMMKDIGYYIQSIHQENGKVVLHLREQK